MTAPAACTRSAPPARIWWRTSSSNSIVGKAYDVQRGPRRATHRINVAEAIGRGDLSVQRKGLSTKRREKVERLEDDQIVAQTECSGIACAVGPDQKVGMIKGG